ncbi:unnamed protein product [Calypogeia fissa]
MAKFGKVLQVQQRALTPEVPLNPDRKEKLRVKLAAVGCGALLDLPWGFLNEDIVREVASNSPPSQFQVVAYTGQRVISWPKVLEDVIGFQAKSLHLKAPTSLACYLVHLYAHKKVLTKKEHESYESVSYLAQIGDLDVVEVDESEIEEEEEDV